MSTLGNCMTDNQGNPIPQVGGVCNLASMHIDASVIDEPTPEQAYGGNMINNGQLDWEFYQIDPRPSAGAQPASQNDFYGCLYSMGSFDSYSDPVPPPQSRKLPPMPIEEVVAIQEKAIVKTAKGAEERVQHSDNELMILLGIIALAAYLGSR